MLVIFGVGGSQIRHLTEVPNLFKCDNRASKTRQKLNVLEPHNLLCILEFKFVNIIIYR